MIGKSKGVIISSEAKDRFHIRSPQDVACLCFIFGLSEEQGKFAVSEMCRKVLLAAECRRLGKTPVLIKYEDVDTSTTEDEDDEEVGENDEIEMDVDDKTASDTKKRRISNNNESLKTSRNKKVKK
jgi:RNase P/RNase MRP subunit p30